MSNNNQALELTDITAPLLAATQGTVSHIIDDLLDSAERGENRRKQRPPSICKVSRILRDDNESSFSPQLVSIGPIHREDPKLKEFEWQKKCYLNDLLNRCYSPKKTLEACLLMVKDLIPKIRESYADVKNYSDDELARMMVMDGCFILEFCFKHNEADLYLPNKLQNLRIAMDCSMGKVSFTLSQVLDDYLAPYIKLFRSQICHGSDVVSDSTPAHVLGYLHKRYQLVVAKSSNPIHTAALHSIVELDRSGMNFKPHQEDEWSMTIKFQSSLFPCLPWFGSKSTLLMPTLVIDNFTELILRNFIAYEQSFPQGRYYFTSYAHAMDTLIDTREDIAKLVESKVLVNMLVSNQEAADMINELCRHMFVTDFCYTREFKQMDKYYNGFWPQIKRIYFSNPWNVFNLLFGIIVFLVTVVSGIFTVLEYYR